MNRRRLPLFIFLGSLAVIGMALAIAFGVSDGSSGGGSSSDGNNLRGSETQNESLSGNESSSGSNASGSEEVVNPDGNVVDENSGEFMPPVPPSDGNDVIYEDVPEEEPAFVGTIAAGPWVQCIGLTVAACEVIIENDTKDISPVEIIPVEFGMHVTLEVNLDRVRIWYIVKDEELVVVLPPPRRN